MPGVIMRIETIATPGDLGGGSQIGTAEVAGIYTAEDGEALENAKQLAGLLNVQAHKGLPPGFPVTGKMRGGITE